LPNPAGSRSEHNFAWLLEARNKKGLALDLTKPEARRCVSPCLPNPTSSHHMPPQFRAKLGITYDHLAASQRSSGISASFTGYGEQGEEPTSPASTATLLGAFRPDGSGPRR